MENRRSILSSKNLYLISVHIAVVLLTFEVLVLSNQNRKLKEGLAGATLPFKEGDYFSLSNIKPFLKGEICDTSRAQLIFLFTTTCPHCKKAIPVWKTIDSIARMRPNSLSLTAICLDPVMMTEEFVKLNRISFAVALPNDSKEFMKSNHIAAVPGFFIRSRDGRIQRFWTGELSPSDFTEVVKAIKGPKNG